MYLYNSATHKKEELKTHTPDPIMLEIEALKERIAALEAAANTNDQQEEKEDVSL